MWFHFKISTTRISLCIVLAIVTIANNFGKSHKIPINDDTVQSIEKFMDDLYERNNNTHIINKPTTEQNYHKKLKLQNVPPSVVLMMKLISYYEDKFRIANHEPTERGTTIRKETVQTEDKSSVSNKIIRRIEYNSKNRYDNNIFIPDVIIA